MIDLERRDGAFILHMRVEDNRMNDPFLIALEEALGEVAASDEPGALVTTGHDRFYSTGLDLEWTMGDEEKDVPAFMQRLHRIFARVLTFPRITIAAIGGHAFAAGAMLAMAHDFRFMRADKGFFCLPEIDLATGQGLTDGMVALLKARIPAQTLHESLMTGRRYGGHDALAAGLVDAIHAEEALLPAALDRAKLEAERHRETLVALKRCLYADAVATLENFSWEA